MGGTGTGARECTRHGVQHTAHRSDPSGDGALRRLLLDNGRRSVGVRPCAAALGALPRVALAGNLAGVLGAAAASPGVRLLQSGTPAARSGGHARLYRASDAGLAQATYELQPVDGLQYRLHLALSSPGQARHSALQS